MKTLIAYRKSTGLTSALSTLISLTFMIVWLPFIRSIFDGTSYVWGTVFYGIGFRGAGISPDFIFIIIQLLFYAALMISMFWFRKRTWFYVLLFVWFMNVFGNLIAEIIISGDIMFHGDTMGVHISLTPILVPLCLLALVFIYLIIRADSKAEEQAIPWSSKNRKLLWLFLLGPLPIQAALLATGEISGTTDQIGVVMCIAQCFLIPRILRPYMIVPQPVTVNN